MDNEEIEHESPSILEGQVECPNERLHFFPTLSELHKWTEAFRIHNYNVRSGYRQDNGEFSFQLTYSVVNN